VNTQASNFLLPVRKSWWLLLLCGIMLLASTAVFVVSADAPPTLVIAAVGLALSACIRRPLPRTTRTSVYAVVTVLIVAVMETQLFPVEPQRFFLFPADIFCPMLIYLGIALTFFELRESHLSTLQGLAILSMMLAGNTISSGMENPRFESAAPALEHFHLHFGICLLVQMLAFVGLQLSLGRARRHSWARRGLVGASVLMLVVMVLGLRVAGFYYERLAHRMFQDFFRQHLGRRSSRVVFGKEVNLWRTVPHASSQNKRVVLRARSASEPGYLRGRVYRDYVRGNWTADSAKELLPGEKQTGRRVATVFLRERADLSNRLPEPVNIYPARGFSSDVLLVPGAAFEFKLVAEKLSNSADGVLSPEDWERQGGYSCRRDAISADPAYAFPRTSDTSAPWLAVPANLQADLAEIASRICPSTPGKIWTASDKMARVAAYLLQNYSYALGVPMTDSKLDPVMQFLQVNRKGHCELFATACVLLLRELGVPARYVTGFVCAESQFGGRYWLARLQDAHAWVEAYDDAGNRWQLVEPTPPTGVPDGNSDTGLTDTAWQALAAAWQSLLAKLKRGDAAEAIMELLRSGGGFFLRGEFWLILTILLGLGWYWRRHRRLAGMRKSSPLERRLREVFSLFEERLRKAGFVRGPGGTGRDLCRLVAQSDFTHSDEIVGLLDEYERLRYAQPRPHLNDVESFAKKLAEALPRILPKNSHCETRNS
jgi:transglutaminase-like putative cysteine protease